MQRINPLDLEWLNPIATLADRTNKPPLATIANRFLSFEPTPQVNR